MSMFNTTWFNTLIKPHFYPPAWLFTPVWIILYGIIFASLLIYTIKPARNKLRGYVYFIIQMLLNLVWTPVFFLLHNITLALVIIILMDLFVILTIKRFYTVSKFAGMMLIPYFLWILFATYLNTAFLILN